MRFAFCSGADLKKHGEGKRNQNEKKEYIKKAHLLNKKIYEFEKPVIACVNGHARGAGSELALCCDFIFIGEEATIGFPETGLGTFVGGGVTYILPRIVGLTKAKYLIYSGKVLTGKEAVEIGLSIETHPLEILFSQTFEFALNLAEKAPVSMKYAKKMIHKTWNLQYEDASDLEAEAILSCMATKDWQEGIDAFKEKRKPVYKGE